MTFWLQETIVASLKNLLLSLIVGIILFFHLGDRFENTVECRRCVSCWAVLKNPLISIVWRGIFLCRCFLLQGLLVKWHWLPSVAFVHWKRDFLPDEISALNALIDSGRLDAVKATVLQLLRFLLFLQSQFKVDSTQALVPLSCPN